MSSHVKTAIRNQVGLIELDRPKALNSLSLDMIRTLTQVLSAWRADPEIRIVVIRGAGEKAFCAGGDIRFFHEIGTGTPREGSALLEDFFSEEYALNHLIHHFPKPYVSLMDGIVMGGGMGIAQGGPTYGIRVVTERTRMAMPEVNIGLFPDVGGSYFLSRAPGKIGAYLGLSGAAIAADDAIYAGLADVFIPSDELPALATMLESAGEDDAAEAILEFAAPFRDDVSPDDSTLAIQQARIDRHFCFGLVADIVASLAQDPDPFARNTLAAMQTRSPLMMCVTLEQLRRGTALSVADCLRMERSMVRRCFEHGEVLEGIRALAIDKDNAPRWTPATLDQVSDEMVQRFFEPAWPAWSHPLRHLE